MSDYRSYKSLFKIKWKIYAIGDWPLPRPIPVDVFVIFLLFLLPSFFLASPVSNILEINRFGATLLVDIVVTSLCVKFDPQGRPFLEFFYDLCCYFGRSKQSDFCRTIPKSRKQKLHWELLDLEDR